MTEIYVMTHTSQQWEQTIHFAENCLWSAGKCLTKMMTNNEFLSYERVITACVDDKVVGFCTFTRKDEMPDKYDFEGFIGFVFVDEEHRGQRLSEKMINTAGAYAKRIGYEKVYIMSGEKGLYEKYGFSKIGEYDTIYGTFEQLFVRKAVL
ncbi:MAG: GNAT family N-acetyltransferase [Clostridiales bacterium]|nr:GNAT family N-acetyltransferase [Clostridiales bacterium]